MALSLSRFVVYALHLVGAAKWINQVDTAPWNLNASLFEESSGSQTDRAFVATREINPTIPISTSDLTILGTIGFGGYNWTGASAIPVVAYAREMPLGALPSAVGGSVHISNTISDGLLVPMSISAGHNQIARLQLMLHALLGAGGSSGATPFVIATLQAISTSDSPEPGTNNMYVPRAIKFTTTATSPAVTPRLIRGITQISVNLGIQVFKEGTDSDVYPSFASIIARNPVIEFSTTDLTLVKEVGDGIQISTLDTYFAQVAANGQRTLDASALHTKFACTTGMLHYGAVGLGHQHKGEANFTFTPAAASPIVAVSTTAAIPTS